MMLKDNKNAGRQSLPYPMKTKAAAETIGAPNLFSNRRYRTAIHPSRFSWLAQCRIPCEAAVEGTIAERVRIMSLGWGGGEGKVI